MERANLEGACHCFESNKVDHLACEYFEINENADVVKRR